MAIDIRMPEVSADITEADVVAWLIEPGETVQAGEVLLEIETEKSTVEIESPATGVLTEILVAEGTSAVAVGTVLARLEPSEAAQEAPERQPDAAVVDPVASEPPPRDGAADDSATQTTRTVPPEASPAPSGQLDGAASSSPEPAATALARRLADQAGLELGDVEGSGAHGRITRADVEERIGGAPESTPARDESPPRPASSSSAPTPTPTSRPSDPTLAQATRPGRESTRVPLTRMRRTIAARLSDSKRTIPHFYLAVDCEIDSLLEVRRQLNETSGAQYKISVNDFIVRATALALREVPAANVTFDEDALIQHVAADVAVAVATDGGLITPIVRDADLKGLADISAEVRALAMRARAGKLSPRDYQGGSFSVSNLGMYGIDSVYAIVNPPHSGILGVGQGRAAAVVRDGEIAPATVMTCTLAADHRAVDGAVGAQWLAAFKRMIESPLEMSL
jgi:pyruvate dehydrogenase E2 component (dihydrolipoamide acetyltransferase)